MNLSEQKFLTGATDLDRIVFARRGRRVIVLDPIRRRRQAIRLMLDRGHRVRDVARMLKCPMVLVLLEKKNRNISDSTLTAG